MNKKNKAFHIFFICLLIMCIFSSAVYASEIYASSKFGHSAMHPDFGLKKFWYRPYYVGEKYSGTVDAVKDHDFYAYKTSDDVIFPSEIGNGDPMPTKIEMLNSNKQVFSRIYGFDSGLIRPVMISGDDMMLKTKYNNSDIYAANTGTNYIRVPILFSLPDDWSLCAFSDDITTNSF